MLTSFFASSKPAHTVTVIGYMTIAYIVANSGIFSAAFEWKNILVMLGCWFVYILGLLLFGFIAQKNELTGGSSYKLILFAAFTAAFPSLYYTTDVLVAGFCVLVALRRIISLRSGLTIERKLYDASFWLAVASLWYFWSVIFFIVVFIGIFLYAHNQARFWIIPLLGIGTILLFLSCYVLYIDSDQSYILHYVDHTSFDFSGYSSLKVLIGISFVVSVLLWCIWSYIATMRTTVFSQRSSYLLIIASSIVALGIVLIGPNKSGAEWYFFIPGLAIIGANYLERSQNLLFKEFLLWVAIAVPVIIYVF